MDKLAEENKMLRVKVGIIHYLKLAIANPGGLKESYQLMISDH